MATRITGRQIKDDTLTGDDIDESTLVISLDDVCKVGATTTAAMSLGNITPHANNTYDLGSSSNQWAEVNTVNIDSSGIATYNTVEYSNSNTMKFNQYYLGNASGSYFSANEYQKVVTIIPASDNENYQVIGRITAQNAGETHTVYFNAALRSGDPLPALFWSTSYREEYNGNRYIDPQLWTKETTTAGFIFAFKTLSTIYGNVTVDIDVVPRSSTLKANVTINNSVSSEQALVDAGYTANDMEKAVRQQAQNTTFEGSITDKFGSEVVGGMYQLDDGLIQNPNSSYSRFYFPADDTLVETVGASSVNYKVAPFDGELIKAQVRSSTNFSGKTLTLGLHKGSGTDSAYSTTYSASIQVNGDVANTVYEFDFTEETGTSISTGEIFGFSLQLSENWAGTENIHFTSVVKYDPYTV